MEDSAALASPDSPPDLAIEVPVASWAPLCPAAGTVPASTVLFTDGVRRVDARVWIDDGDGASRLGLCASYAAGIVRSVCSSGPSAERSGSGGRAEVVAVEVGRGLFTGASSAEPISTRLACFPVRAAAGDAPDDLVLAVQQRMGDLEIDLAGQVDEADLIVIDGPLRGRQRLEPAVGYVKTHHVAYLPPVVGDIVGELVPGQRTPLFLTTTSWSRYSWYMRLPGGSGHAWAGVVRCEASADLAPAGAVALADLAAATLPRFASRAHKDPRAPQNLYPIAGLERALRHRLGDPGLLYRALCSAAA
jgi:hypothetical protein